MLQDFVNIFSEWRKAQPAQSSSASMEVIDIASSDSESEDGLVFNGQHHFPTTPFLGASGLVYPTRQLPSSFASEPQGTWGASHIQNNGESKRAVSSFRNSNMRDSQQPFSGSNGGHLSQHIFGGPNGGDMSNSLHFQPREGPSYPDFNENTDTKGQTYYAHASAPVHDSYFPDNGAGVGSFRSGMSVSGPPFYMKSEDDLAYARALTTSFSHVNAPSQSSKHDGIPLPGEEIHVGNDERLIYQAALQDLSQSKILETDVPEGLLTVPLLRHQKIALAWMLQKEKSSVHCLGGFLADDQGLGKTVSTIALIQMQRSLTPKVTLDDPHHLNLEPLILDDDDEFVDEKTNVCVDVHGEKRAGGKRKKKKAPQIGRPSAGTLIVCPASVLRQWPRELDEKVAEGAKLDVLVYHGSSRTKDPAELAKHDVVVTTYSIVSNEVPKQSLGEDDDDEQKNADKYGISSDFSASNKKKKLNNGSKKGKKGNKDLDDPFAYDSGPLARVNWFRVVLDEAQTIKNFRTLVAGACCGLRANRRWCLSGTPMQNAVDDLFSYFRFFRYDPYANYKTFCSSIKYPITKNSVQGYKKLQAVMKTMMLRRTKETVIDGEPILKLPSKTIFLNKVEFSPEEREFYTRLETDSRTQFKKYADEGTVKQNYANILLMLLRLRQACNHPVLVRGFQSHSTGKDSLRMAKNLPKEMWMNLLRTLEAPTAICGICNDISDDAIVTICAHVFCYQCVSERLIGDDNSCPAIACKEILDSKSVFSKNILVSCEFDDEDDGIVDELPPENFPPSSKIKAAMEILHSVCGTGNSSSTAIDDECSEFPYYQECHSNLRDANHTVGSSSNIPEKVIVFSQWTGMLDLLEKSLKDSSIKYRRFDGAMTLPSRDKAVKDFTTKPEVTVMIMSLKAGNLGLNLIAACHVILLDLWWNPTTEDQAIDRAHRIGQTRPVTVSRLTIQNTVEDRILALQEQKRKMVSSAFGDEKGAGSGARLTVEDLRYLFMGGS